VKNQNPGGPIVFFEKKKNGRRHRIPFFREKRLGFSSGSPAGFGAEPRIKKKFLRPAISKHDRVAGALSVNEPGGACRFRYEGAAGSAGADQKPNPHFPGGRGGGRGGEGGGGGGAGGCWRKPSRGKKNSPPVDPPRYAVAGRALRHEWTGGGGKGNPTRLRFRLATSPALAGGEEGKDRFPPGLAQRWGLRVNPASKPASMAEAQGRAGDLVGDHRQAGRAGNGFSTGGTPGRSGVHFRIFDDPCRDHPAPTFHFCPGSNPSVLRDLVSGGDVGMSSLPKGGGLREESQFSFRAMGGGNGPRGWGTPRYSQPGPILGCWIPRGIFSARRHLPLPKRFFSARVHKNRAEGGPRKKIFGVFGGAGNHAGPGGPPAGAEEGAGGGFGRWDPGPRGQ